MKVLRYIIVLFCVWAYYMPSAHAQGYTSKGKEFWTTYMAHISGAGTNGSRMSVYITSDVNTTGTIEVADGSFSQSFTVTANQVTTVAVPATAYTGTEGQFYKGIHITSANPIAVYAHIYANNISGATLLLPVNTMGKDYYSLNYTQISNAANSYSSFSVIATEDNTTVEITPSAALNSGKAAKVPFQVTLKKGELYQGLSATDLTGTRIKSVSTSAGVCKKIAVFSGSSKIGIGCTAPNTLSSDNLFQQVYPTASWGKNYITAPLKDRNYDIYRIVLSDPATNVQLNGTPLSAASFVNGYYEFKSQSTNVVTADKPIQVIQYAVTQNQTIGCTTLTGDVGDPEMIYLNPIEQSIDRVTLYSTSQFLITKNFINVVIPTTAVSTFTLDGTPYNAFNAVPGNPAYSYAQISVASGTHNIQASEGFNAIAYGFGSTESYGYAAGTSLKNLNQYIALNQPGSTTTTLSGCTGVEYKLQLVLPFQTTNIKWQFSDGTATAVDAAPVFKYTTVVNGKTLYIYEYPNLVKYNSGDYSVIATVFNPTADECGSDLDIQFDFNIIDPPDAKFTSSGNVCLSSSTVTFTDTSDPKTSIIKNWLWDFGDGQTSTVKSTTHTYATSGDFNVTVTVMNENGCTTTSLPQKIHVYAKPVPAFKYSAVSCETKDIAFTDQSTTADDTFTKWEWDFGDGATSAVQNPTHVYTQAGTYTVKLKVTTASGCSEEKTQSVVVNPQPVVDFALPDVCLSDAFAAFTNKSTIADGTESEFVYQWNFGDANATAANPNTSSVKDPKHKYTKTGTYQVILIVTSKYGCVATKQYTLTVNGDTPKAAFAVNNASNLCSSDDVVFNDQSSVNFGNITRVGWIFDFNNNPKDTTWYDKDDIPADHLFRHNYGLFTTPTTKTYAIKMIVYSGQTCFNEFGPLNITIKANPQVDVSQIGSVCLQDGTVQVTATEIHGYTGSGLFSGPGISPTGLFDPVKAGVGTFTISYVFTASNGCTYSNTQQVTVNAMPKVTLDRALTILQGASITLKAQATGDGLTYKWTPAIGLDHDDVLNPVATPADNITYTLTATSAAGCVTSATVDIIVLKVPQVPNTFTPNGDGINDYWNIEYLYQYTNCTVEVYNRYGEKVYSSIGYSVAWDGRYKGADLPAGTYYYIITPKNNRKVITGSVTIIR